MKRFSLALLLAALCAACINDDPNEGPVDLMPGDRIPSFSVTMDDGSTVTDRTLAGRPALVVFFHTDCGDCRAELPVVQEIYETYGTQLRTLCISREQSAPQVAAYWAAEGLTLPYSAQEDRRVYHLFARTGIPRLYVIDREGTIRSRFTDSPLASYAAVAAAVEAVILP